MPSQNRDEKVRSFKTVLLVSAAVVLACAIGFYFATSTMFQRAPTNPITSEFRAENLRQVRARFVSNGAEIYGLKGRPREWFDIPLDIWGKIEPLAIAAKLTAVLQQTTFEGLDFAEVELTSKLDSKLSIFIFWSDGMSIFAFRVNQNIFTYKNTHNEITKNFLSEVTCGILSQFQAGDSPEAREKCQESLDTFSQLAIAIEKAR